MRLLRSIVQDLDGAHALKSQPRVVSWIQLIVEHLLITILRHTGELVRESSKGHAKPGSNPSREAINARDSEAEVDVLNEYWPTLHGRRREIGPRAVRGRGSGRGGRGRDIGRGGRGRGACTRPSPKAKTRSKAKATPKRRATLNTYCL